VAVHPRVLSLLVGPGGRRLTEIEAAARRRFFLVAAESQNGHVHLDHAEVLEQGKLEALAPSAPVEEGATVELKLVEVGLHDPGAGVAKLDGWDIVVADAAKLVGKKLSVTIGRVLDGVAYGLPSDTAALPTPITFEAEAEKPTRAPAARKAVPATAPRRAKKPAEPVVDEPEPEPEVAVEEVEESEAAATPTDGAPPKKKRTRRGTRGGRGRKKPATAGGAAPAEEEAAETVAAPRSAPKIHVPSVAPAAEADETVAEEAPGAEADEVEVDASADGAPKKKRTRRGTRGGRKRRKPSTNGAPAASGDATAPAAVAEAVDEADPEEPAEYVPMSEWIEDFERRERKAG
ncbi:MAG: hypothetical protein ACRELC_12090, partial [Gemmatimonadota bacterium]